jgi:hypothetical protein
MALHSPPAWRHRRGISFSRLRDAQPAPTEGAAEPDA